MRCHLKKDAINSSVKKAKDDVSAADRIKELEAKLAAYESNKENTTPAPAQK